MIELGVNIPAPTGTWLGHFSNDITFSQKKEEGAGLAVNDWDKPGVGPAECGCQEVFPRAGERFELLTGLTACYAPPCITLVSSEPRLTVCSGVVGGGLGYRRFFINRQVDKGYSPPQPAREMEEFIESNFSDVSGGCTESWSALMTAARLEDAAWVRLWAGGLTAGVIVSAGVNNACSAGITGWLPQGRVLPAGTINVMVFFSRPLTPAALVNAVQTVTEAKTAVLVEFGVTCPATGGRATGTSTDAVMVAGGPGEGRAEIYAGPLTAAGYLAARGVRTGLSRALVRYREREKREG